MNNLSIEELKDVVANAKTSLEQYLALELIAIRELKGDQVQVEGGLLPCPFCAGNAIVTTIENEDDACFGGDVITCSGCGASSHVEFGRKENLASAWNTRAESPKLGLVRLSKDVREFLQEAINDATQCEDGDMDHGFADQLSKLLSPLFTAPQKPVTLDADMIRDANRYRFLRDEDAWGEDSDSWDFETRTGLISWGNLCEVRTGDFDAAVDARMAASDIPFLNPATAPQKPVVLLNSSTVMSRAYVVKQIEAAGCIVHTGATDKEDDHQPSAPAVLHDVLTAVSIGGSRTELIDALTSIKPKFGTPGSRDVDVRAAHLAIDKAIEKLSNL